MLSKSKPLYSLSHWRARLYLNSYRHDYSISQNAFGTAAEPIKANDIPIATESPELPGWVKKSSVKDKTANKPENDDFVPPSLSYWIENHKSRVQEDVDMKSIVNNIVESDVDKISKILKNHFKSPDLVVKALHGCCDVDLSDGLVEQILRRFSHEWIPSFGFFKWAETKRGIKHSPELYNLMVDNLGKTRKFEIMWDLAEEMKKSEGYVTLETMTKIMRRLAKAGKYDDAIEAFEKMNLFGVEKDITSMNILLDSLVKQGSVEHAERAYVKLKEHILPIKQTFNVLVHGWCKIRQIDKAKKTVDEMKAHGLSPDVVTYTSFIEAYCREKDFRKANSTLEEMEKDGITPGVVVYTIMMNAYAKAKEINKSIELYEQMKKNNCSPDASFYNVLASALSRAGRLKDADDVFEDMSRQGVAPDVSSYNTLIFIAAHHLEEEKALGLLMKMEENKNCKPNIDTYAPLLKMCCRLKRMKVLSFLLSHMFANDVSLDPGTYSLLISRLSKGGNVVRACSFFEEMVEKGFVPMDVTYETLIKALEKKGMSEEKRKIEEVMAQAKQPGFG
ncbi:hypothetical protein CASFOL_021544 [Castilleja foliolosa]|uniref:Pentatricopeptide repeat-containing protein n=1 Tax=Castilleja foliolosa TaxID=1961234 RepID=A0ABD3CWV7_9LAMI